MRESACTKHGDSRTKLYKVWNTMKQRCYNPNHESYKNYGAVGISVCESWVESFESFRKDMGGSYKEGLHIDRKDSLKNYELSNCRWVTRKQNNRNTAKRKSTTSKYKGVTVRQQVGGIKWVAQITVDHQSRYLGLYSTEEEAALAYNKEALKCFGKYARLNDVPNRII